MSERRYLILDYETRSVANIKLVGGHEYARHPSTKVLCVAWRLGTMAELPEIETKVWSPAIPSPYGELVRALCDPDVTIVAHNALFEQLITRYVLSRIINRPELKEIPVSRWICTAALAATHALPRKLEKVGAALSLPVQKDKEGHRLMLKMSQPRKARKGEDPSKIYWHTKKSDLLRLMQYCKTDVDAETELLLYLPPLSPSERRVWELDQKINTRGFAVDRARVKTILRMIATESRLIETETRTLARGEFETTKQVAKVQAWLRARGVSIPNVQKKTIEDALASGLVEGDARRLLELRLMASKSSTAKYIGFESRSRSDGRLRDILMYHAASTGRWAGLGLQPHNFPRGTIKDSLQASDILGDGDLELIRMIYGSPMEAFSSCLRTMIVAPEGRQLFCADFNAIEVRVLFWLAKHVAGIRAFEEGRDLYVEQAQDIYGITAADLIDFIKRQLGKKVILGCGFGMGKDKFFDSCLQDRLEISKDLAATAVASYREKHAPVVRMWSNIEKAAIYAVQNPGKKITVNRTKWFVEKDFLYCELPSGRRLAYYRPEVKLARTKWDTMKMTLYHYQEVGQGKSWVRAGTYGGKLVENVVQAVARDLMASAMLRLEDSGYEIAVTVHDEVLSERDLGTGSQAEFEKLMSHVPAWAEGCPIKVTGWTGSRYRK